MRSRGSFGRDDPFGKKVPHSLAPARHVGGEEVVEAPVLADDDDHMFDRRLAGMDQRGNP
jgi:hypothetical protein